MFLDFEMGVIVFYIKELQSFLYLYVYFKYIKKYCQYRLGVYVYVYIVVKKNCQLICVGVEREGGGGGEIYVNCMF